MSNSCLHLSQSQQLAGIIKAYPMIRFNHFDFGIIGVMATNVNFEELLEKKYPSYTVEVNAFLNSLDVASSTEVSIDQIYQAISNDKNIDSNLKLLYHEAVYGTDKNVKKRITNRVVHFRRTLR